MAAQLTALDPREVADRLRKRRVVLVDVRDRDEFAQRHIADAVCHPLSSFEAAGLNVEASKAVVFTCRSGMRTAAHGERLAAAVEGEAFVLRGGVDGWAAAGLPVSETRKAPVSLMNQVRAVAGVLILLGAALGVLVSPGFLAITVLVGAGLTFAGVTGYCGLARLLALAPWNRKTPA